MKTRYNIISRMRLQMWFKLPATFIMLCFGLYAQGQTCVPLAATPSNGQNNIITYIPQVAGITSPSALPAKNTCEVIQTIQYFDGLGRLLQTVQTKGLPAANKDLVTPVAYDGFGREVTKYLPYAATGTAGSLRTNPYADQATYYSPGTATAGVVRTTTPYAQTFQEFSPLNRPLEAGAPGADWQPGTHTVKTKYTLNDNVAFNPANTLGSRKVSYYTTTVNTSGSRTLGTNSSYNDGELQVTVSMDENWVTANGCAGTTETYTDKEGHVILKRTYNQTGSVTSMLSTYYVYDDLGNLAFVLPPLSGADAALPSAAKLDNLCYQYRYDERNRLTQKRIPGKDWEFVVYNQLDQPVLSQDGNQRVNNQWTVTKYDALGRAVITGLWNAGSVIPLTTLQASIYAGAQWDVRSAADVTTGYAISSYPALSKILTVHYYDDYANIPGFPSGYNMPSNGSNMTKGLLTATKTAVLNTIGDATPAMLWEVNYYDDRNRNIKTYKQHYLGTSLSTNNHDEITSTYNFTNQVTGAVRKHFAVGGLKLTITNKFIYDHVGRKVKTWQQIKNAIAAVADTNRLISRLDYNEAGQPWKKNLDATSVDSTHFKQMARYTYNERGWLASSNAPLFKETLQYNTDTVKNGMQPVKQYNGNIASQSWGTASAPDTKTYNYKYDNINRLSSGISSNGYAERGITYDAMGNISNLSRLYNNTLIDSLAYDYQSGASTQLNQVTDRSANTGTVGFKTGTWGFGYDANGNMTADNSKGITGTTGITYNLLNLPQAIASKNIIYVYDATGRKLKMINGSQTTDYIDGIQYVNNTISFIQTEEGRAIPNGDTSYNYEYTLTDHLGNSRVNFDVATGIARRVQTDDYLPFGMDVTVGNRPNPENKYLYNKKELQDGLGVYDYGARFYDPVIARWTSVDPLIESNHQAWTPYAYVYNDPILLMDPDGRDSTQRAQAQAKAREFVKKNDNGKGNSYQMGGKGNPGEPCDCSNLVSKSVVAGGEKDPNKGTSNGVTNIADNTTPVDSKDVVPGNIVILHGSTHTGIITLVQRDKDGNIVNEQMIDSGGQPSSGTSGPRVSNLVTNGKENYWGQRVDGYRKWDTKPDAPSTPSAKPQQQSPGLWNSIKTSVTNTFNYIMDNL